MSQPRVFIICGGKNTFGNRIITDLSRAYPESEIIDERIVYSLEKIPEGADSELLGHLLHLLAFDEPPMIQQKPAEVEAYGGDDLRFTRREAFRSIAVVSGDWSMLCQANDLVLRFNKHSKTVKLIYTGTGQVRRNVMQYVPHVTIASIRDVSAVVEGEFNEVRTIQAVLADMMEPVITLIDADQYIRTFYSDVTADRAFVDMCA